MNIGDEFIPFDLPGSDGRTHSAADYSDKEALVIIFSCNHCPYVRAWEDRMIQIQADYEARGVQLIAVNANDAQKYPQDNMAAMQERTRARGFNFPYLQDESQAFARAYGATRTPEIFVFDAARRLRYHGLIDDNYDDATAVTSPYLRQALDHLLRGHNPPISDTTPLGCTIKWK